MDFDWYSVNADTICIHEHWISSDCPWMSVDFRDVFHGLSSGFYCSPFIFTWRAWLSTIFRDGHRCPHIFIWCSVNFMDFHDFHGISAKRSFAMFSNVFKLGSSGGPKTHLLPCVRLVYLLPDLPTKTDCSGIGDEPQSAMGDRRVASASELELGE